MLHIIEEKSRIGFLEAAFTLAHKLAEYDYKIAVITHEDISDIIDGLGYLCNNLHISNSMDKHSIAMVKPYDAMLIPCEIFIISCPSYNLKHLPKNTCHIITNEDYNAQEAIYYPSKNTDTLELQPLTIRVEPQNFTVPEICMLLEQNFTQFYLSNIFRIRKPKMRHDPLELRTYKYKIFDLLPYCDQEEVMQDMLLRSSGELVAKRFSIFIKYLSKTHTNHTIYNQSAAGSIFGIPIISDVYRRVDMHNATVSYFDFCSMPPSPNKAYGAILHKFTQLEYSHERYPSLFDGILIKYVVYDGKTVREFIIEDKHIDAMCTKLASTLEMMKEAGMEVQPELF